MYVKKLLELPTIKRLLTSKNKQTNKKNQKKTQNCWAKGEGFHQEREAESCHQFISGGLETTLGEYEGCDNSLWFLLKVSSFFRIQYWCHLSFRESGEKTL